MMEPPTRKGGPLTEALFNEGGFGQRRCGARGRGRTYPPGSGGAGAPLAGNKTGREELADGERYPRKRISRRKRGPAP